MRNISSLSDLEKHRTVACCLKFVANLHINTPGTLSEAESCKTGKPLLANQVAARREPRRKYALHFRAGLEYMAHNTIAVFLLDSMGTSSFKTPSPSRS